MTNGEIADRIDCIVCAMNDAKEAKNDSYYAACFPIEHAYINQFIDDCRQQIKTLERCLELKNELDVLLTTTDY